MVELDPAKLAANNISISQISGMLAANNLVLPAGSLPTTTADGTTISIPVSAQHQLLLNSPNDILSLAVGVKTPAAGSGCDGARRRSPWATWAPSSWFPSTPAATPS